MKVAVVERVAFALLMAGSSAGCDGGVEGDSGVEMDAGAGVDAGDRVDAGDDASQPDAFVPIGDTATVELSFVDVESNARPEGLRVCVPEFPTIPCGAPDADGVVRVRVPLGLQYVSVSAPDYRRMLFPVGVSEAGFRFGNIPMFTRAFVTAAAGASGVVLDESRGMGVLAVWVRDSRDPDAVAGATIGGVDGTVVYTSPGTPPIPDPSLPAATRAGSAILFGQTPGRQTVTWTQPGASCSGGIAGGWIAGETASLEMPFEAGSLTLSLLACTGLVGADLRECDLFAQDCSDPERPKCRSTLFVDDAGNAGYGARCVADGPAALRESCTRPEDEPGDDTCSGATFCANSSLPPGEGRVCRGYCLRSAECEAGEHCSDIRRSDSGSEAFGICVPSCDPFGDTCAEGTSCLVLTSETSAERSLTGQCVTFGTVGRGGDCSSQRCAAGLGCVTLPGSTPTCLPACDDTHPCDTGTCESLPGLDRYGWCR